MEALARIATVGTSRSADDGATLAGHPAVDLVTAAAIEARERRLLVMAGAAAVYETCGRKPQTGVAAPEAAPADAGPVASQRVAHYLFEAARASDKKLLRDALGQLAELAVRLPHEFLPTALDTTDDELRTRLGPLMGERGRWLARFRREWAWAEQAAAGATVDEAEIGRAWTDGSAAERRAALVHWRRTAPEESRRRLAEVWKTEKADTRGELLEVFAENLSADDEPLLESSLDDRSSGVRQIAARLLTRLPNSRLAGRMTARADVMLSGKTSGLLRKTFALAAEPPQEIDAAWERDGVTAKPPGNVGKRAFWLKTVLAAVRLSHWTEKFSHEPAALVEAIARDDYADAVVEGWTQATVARAGGESADLAWLAALAGYWTDRLNDAPTESAGGPHAQMKSLVEVLPAAAAEMVVERLLNSTPTFQWVIGRLLPLVPTPWSEGFSRRLLDAARRALEKEGDDRAFAWSTALAVAADAVPIGLLPSLAPETWSVREGESWQRRGVLTSLERFADRVRLRRTFREALVAAAGVSPGGSVSPGST